MLEFVFWLKTHTLGWSQQPVFPSRFHFESSFSCINIYAQFSVMKIELLHFPFSPNVHSVSFWKCTKIAWKFIQKKGALDYMQRLRFCFLFMQFLLHLCCEFRRDEMETGCNCVVSGFSCRNFLFVSAFMGGKFCGKF